MREFHKYQIKECIQKNLFSFSIFSIVGMVLCSIFNRYQFKYFILLLLIYFIPTTISEIIKINKKWKQD